MFTRNRLLIAAGAIMAILGAAYFAATAAKAADKNGPANIFADAPLAQAKSWSGCYFVLQGGAVSMDTKARLSDTTPGTTDYIVVDGLGASGGVYGAGAGCDVQLGKSGLVLGILTGYNRFNSAQWNLDIMPPGGVNFATALNSEWNIGARVGFLPTSATMLYALATFSQLKMDAFSGASGGTTIGTLSVPTINGYQIGGGIETVLGGGWFVGAEYRMGLYQNASVPIGTSGYSLNVEPVTHEATARVGYKFNFLGQ